jgi:hypothetical protein
VYVIVDPEVEQNVSLAMYSLLVQEIAAAVTLVIEETFVEQRVLFTMFERYFLDKERAFTNMIADLLRRGDTVRNDNAPLVLRDDVPRWRNIANKRMAYLGDTYGLFKDTVFKNEKEIITLLRVHMKRCIWQYHALIPQLDCIANQWGVSIEDIQSQNDFGSPKSRKKCRKNLTNQENTEQVRPRQQPFGEADALVAGPLARNAQQEETSAAADHSCTVPGSQVPRSANLAES